MWHLPYFCCKHCPFVVYLFHTIYHCLSIVNSVAWIFILSHFAVRFIPIDIIITSAFYSLHLEYLHVLWSRALWIIVLREEDNPPLVFRAGFSRSVSLMRERRTIRFCRTEIVSCLRASDRLLLLKLHPASSPSLSQKRSQPPPPPILQGAVGMGRNPLQWGQSRREGDHDHLVDRLEGETEQRLCRERLDQWGFSGRR
jgi:hypothetical protein